MTPGSIRERHHHARGLGEFFLVGVEGQELFGTEVDGGGDVQDAGEAVAAGLGVFGAQLFGDPVGFPLFSMRISSPSPSQVSTLEKLFRRSRTVTVLMWTSCVHIGGLSMSRKSRTDLPVRPFDRCNETYATPWGERMTSRDSHTEFTIKSV